MTTPGPPASRGGRTVYEEGRDEGRKGVGGKGMRVSHPPKIINNIPAYAPDVMNHYMPYVNTPTKNPPHGLPLPVADTGGGGCSPPPFSSFQPPSCRFPCKWGGHSKFSNYDGRLPNFNATIKFLK